jgi:succinyl-diaminopimelate desuccinylase
VTDALAERLSARTLELVDIASESRDEAALAAHVFGVMKAAGISVEDAGDDCVLAGATARGERPLVLLAGHFDTVPAQDNRPGRRDGDTVFGLGAADMKGALAVMIELAIDRAASSGPLDLGCVFFGREELPFDESALGPLLERSAGLRTADLVVVMEPTAGSVQAGCLGNLNATWTFAGRSGHSARPWLADNALHHAARGIEAIAALEPVDHESGGLRYREVVSVTELHGGIARNVIPGWAYAHVNHRYPPGMSAADAEKRLRALCEPYGALTIDGNAPSGAVPAGNPLMDRLLALAGGDLQPKQAWTPVAEFALAGVDAVNFGPGDPIFAHTREEQVSAAALSGAYRILERLLEGDGG